MQVLFIILVWCMARRQVKSRLTRDALILAPCLSFIRRSCLPGVTVDGGSLLLLIRWSWLPLLFVLLSRQSRPSRRILSFWISTVMCQLVLEALAGCSAPLYWPSTWSQLFWFGLDLPMIDVSWQMAHGVFWTGHRLVSTFGMFHIPIACF